jgi:NitT/TauT family transport system permease protein
MTASRSESPAAAAGRKRWIASIDRLQLAGFTLLILAIWEFAVRLLSIPNYLLPAPSEVAVALYRGFANQLFVGNFFITLLEAVAGFLIAAGAGLLVGTLIAQFRFFERFVFPYVVALQSLPKIAIAPLIIVWFGYGFGSKIVMSATVAFFPILINVIVGLKSVDQDKLDLMRSLKASRWQVFRLVLLPNALPFIFAGLNVAVIFSVLGAIVAEFVGSQAGLGYLLLSFNFNLDIASVFACLVLLAGMGMILHKIIQEAERRLVFWSTSDEVLRL